MPKTVNGSIWPVILIAFLLGAGGSWLAFRPAEPVAPNVRGADSLRAEARPSPVTAQAASPVRVEAYGGTLDGARIFGSLCASCHSPGSGGAPPLTHAQWDRRLSNGKPTLYKHAINGFIGEHGVMPPKGGNSNLSEEQIRVTVDWMLANLQ